MAGWDQDKLSKRFLHQAEAAERYLGQVRRKLKQNRSYEWKFDEYTARFYAFNFLAGLVFESPEALVRELRRMLRGDVPHHPPLDVFDKDQFEQHYQSAVSELLDEFEPRR